MALVLYELPGNWRFNCDLKNGKNCNWFSNSYVIDSVEAIYRKIIEPHWICSIWFCCLTVKRKIDVCESNCNENIFVL